MKTQFNKLKRTIHNKNAKSLDPGLHARSAELISRYKNFRRSVTVRLTRLRKVRAVNNVCEHRSVFRLLS